MARFVVCGETLIDLVQADAGGADSFSSTWLALSAGGPMNSAVALGKLGADTHFLGRVSQDAIPVVSYASTSSRRTSNLILRLSPHRPHPSPW